MPRWSSNLIHRIGSKQGPEKHKGTRNQIYPRAVTRLHSRLQTFFPGKKIAKFFGKKCELMEKWNSSQ
jgi:hypothetical protein